MAWEVGDRYTRVLHKSITERRVANAVRRDDMTGFCISCGASRGNCEPDARNYPCERCGKPHVFGAEELLIAYF